MKLRAIGGPPGLKMAIMDDEATRASPKDFSTQSTKTNL